MDQQLVHFIQSNPKIMMGKPVIAGTRITVEWAGGFNHRLIQKVR
ncbi:MAG: DUF433 domain-containing protein [Anaerolineae bacterium]